MVCVCVQVATSLRRIAQVDGLAEPKYTLQKTIEGKMEGILGWDDLLSYTGFHFIGQMKDVPATIVFPEHDDSGLQRRALRSLEALLGLPHTCLLALAALSKHPRVAGPLFSAVSLYLSGTCDRLCENVTFGGGNENLVFKKS